jgi:hypothetical protein
VYFAGGPDEHHSRLAMVSAPPGVFRECAAHDHADEVGAVLMRLNDDTCGVPRLRNDEISGPILPSRRPHEFSGLESHGHVFLRIMYKDRRTALLRSDRPIKRIERSRSLHRIERIRLFQFTHQDSSLTKFLKPLKSPQSKMRVPSRLLSLSVAGCALFSITSSCHKGNAKPTSESAITRAANPTPTQSTRERDTSAVAQGCDGTPQTVCYRDTARPGDVDEDPMQSPLADWIWFGAEGDSIDISASPSASIATSIGQERDSLHNTAHRFRHRLQNDGVVLVWLAFDEQVIPTLPYTLSVWHNGSASSLLRSTGRSATLSLVSRHKTESFSLVPASIAPTVHDRSQWRIFAQTYKVALVSDSLYELCRFPCTAPDTVKLTPSTNVVRKF